MEIILFLVLLPLLAAAAVVEAGLLVLDLPVDRVVVVLE
jgi:hypothetical protein